jgi:hypothetical protein
VEEPHLLIETHSRIGYSGAPVFAYLSPADQDLTVKFGFQPFLKFDGPLLFPLGVFSRHVNTYGQVRDAPSDNGSPVPGHFAPTPSALGVVIPGWEIFETLSTEDAMTKRKAVEAKWAEEAEGDQPLPTEATPAYAEPAEETLAATEVMMKRLLGVPKDEADEVHRGHTP